MKVYVVLHTTTFGDHTVVAVTADETRALSYEAGADAAREDFYENAEILECTVCDGIKEDDA